MSRTLRLTRALWRSISALILLLVLLYISLPTLLSYYITNALETRGMIDVRVKINRPGWNSWHIPLLSFKYTDTSFPLDLKLEQVHIQFSYQSFKDGLLDQVTIGPSQLTWNTLSLDSRNKPKKSPEFGPPGQGGNTKYERTGLPNFFFPIAVLKIEEFRVNHSLGSSTPQHTIIQGTIQSRGKSITGLLGFRNKDIPTYMAEFAINQSGTVSVLIGQDHLPSQPALTITTHILPEYLSHEGGIQIELESLVTFATTLFPLAPEFHDLTGTFTADWKGRHSLPSFSIGTLSLEGNFALDWHLPTVSPQLKNLHTFSNGNFTLADHVLTILIAPATKGTIDWISNSTTFGDFPHLRDQHQPRSWQWHISQPVDMEIPLAHDPLSLGIQTGQIKVAMANVLEDLTLTLDLGSIHWDQPSGMTGKASFHTTGHLESLKQESVVFDDLTWGIKGELAYSSDHFHMHLTPGTRLASKGIHTPAINLPQVESILRQPISLQAELPSWNWAIHPFQWDVHLHTFSVRNLDPWNIKSLILNISTLERNGPDWRIEGGIQLHELGLIWKGQNFPKVNALLDFSGNSQDITTHYAIHGLPSLFLIKGKVHVSPGKGNGEGTLVLSPLTFQPGRSTLHSLLQPWPWPLFNITTGTVSSSVDVMWTSEKSQAPLAINIDRLQGFLRLEDLGGYFKNTIFNGLDGHFALLGDQHSLSFSPSPVHLRQLQAAIPLSNNSAIVSGSIALTTPHTTINIVQGTAHLLGGQVSVGPVTLNSTQTSHELLMTVEDLSLAQILELEQQDSLRGTGSLYGSLPVKMNFTDIEIQNGWLKARPPGGTLQIDMNRSGEPSWFKSQPNVDLLIQSLKNFHYHTLNVGLDYKKNGILQLDTRLEGKNPDFQSGRPIHFNLKIEENIPALLQSLELVQDLEKSIQKMISPSKVRPSQPVKPAP